MQIKERNDERLDGTLMLIVTNKCNLRCSYCYENHEGKGPISKEIAQEHISEVLNNDKKYRSITISLFGGEPFLHFERIREICEWTWGKKWRVPYVFSFSTNGTLLDLEIKSWLAQNKDRILLVLSADGTPESQNINRSNSFDKIDFDFFVKNWENPQVKMTISRESLKNLARDVIFFHDLGFEFAECNLAMGIDWEDEEYTDVLKQQLDILLDYYRKHRDLNPAQIINMPIGSCENEKVLHKWCGVGRELMTVDVDGKRYPCNFITPMSFSEEELDILLHKDFTNIREILDEKCFEECYLYPVCPTCYGADYKVTQSFKEKDKSICKLMEIEALYSAALMATKIADIEDVETMSVEEKGILYKKINAIKTIKRLYDKSENIAI